MISRVIGVNLPNAKSPFYILFYKKKTLMYIYKHSIRTRLQSGPKNMAKNCEKQGLYLTPQAMYNQFKRPYAGSVSEPLLYL